MADTTAREYSWSLNGERYEGQEASRELAIDDAINSADDIDVGETLYIGVNCAWAPTIDAQEVLDALGDQAQGDIGDGSEGWPDASSDAVAALSDRLTAVLDAWMTEFKQKPHFWSVHEVEKILITPELLTEYGYVPFVDSASSDGETNG